MEMNEFVLRGPEIEKVKSFSVEMAKKNGQSNRDFGNGNIATRTATDFIADTVEGKIAELGVSQVIQRETGYVFDVDFGIYPGRTDKGQDMATCLYGTKRYRNLKRVNIKATRPYSQWLLVEEHGFFSDVYILVKVDISGSVEMDLSVLETDKIKGWLEGYAFYHDFICDSTMEPWFPFSAGEKLLDPASLNFNGATFNTPGSMHKWLEGKKRYLSVTLKAPMNYGLPTNWLRKSYKPLVNYLTKDLVPVKNHIAVKQLGGKNV